MSKVNRALGMLIAMMAIALLAVGIDKGSQYIEKKNYEKERIEKYGQNYADAADWRAKISEVSQSQEDIEMFIRENALWEDEDVIPEEAASEDSILEDSTSGNSALQNGVSGNDIPGNAISGSSISENSISENSISGNVIWDNERLESDVSGNDIPGNAISDSSISENSISGNNIWGNDVSGNGISDNSISGNSVWQDQMLWGTVSGNGLVEITLKDRQKMKSSYEDTLQINQADKAIIAENTIDFSNKKICCLGDSITQAANLVSMEGYEEYAYPTKLRELLNAREVVNLGIGGSSIGRYWENAFVDRYQDIPKDTDIIIVMGGTNDGFCLQKEMVGSFQRRAPRTLIGDLNELMAGLKKNYPEAQIIFVTPLPNVLHDILRKERPNLLPQRIIVNAILQLADEYDIDTINLYDSNLLDSHDAAVIYNFEPDGVHCNPAGYQILAEHIGAEMIRMMQTGGERNG